MSSRYPVLDNRPIDQWRVTELREELRRRKIPTRGLKEELVRRLDEALREEMESAVAEPANGLDAEGVPSSINNEESKPANSQMAEDGVELAKDAGEKVDNEAIVVEIADKTTEAQVGGKVQDEELLDGTGVDQLVQNTVNVSIMKENCITAGDSLESSMKEPGNDETNADNVNSKPHLSNINFHNPDLNDHISEEDPKPKAEDIKFDACDVNNPVSEDSKPCPGIVKISKPDLNDQISEEDPKPKPENLHVSDLNCPSSADFKPQIEAVKNEMSSTNQATKEPHLVDAGVPDLNNQFLEEDSKPYLGDLKPNIFNPNDQVHEEDPKPHPTDFMHNISETDNQVPDVSQVKCESISTDSVSINEKNELSDNLNADNFHLEKKISLPEMVQPSSNKGPIGGDFHSLDGQETCQSPGSMEEADNLNAANLDLTRKNDSADCGSPEKLNLDRSSGDDSMEEDVLESKQIDSSHNIDGAVDKFEVTESDVDMVQTLVEKKDISEGKSEKEDITVEKRKVEDPAVGKHEPSKRQRKWNSETLKVSELQTSKPIASTTPKEASQSTPRWLFTKTDAAVSEEAPKERVVLPSQKSPTTSLRIDRFLRPFTLKAVQELLAKTGTVCSFWMDQIKTHCYVTYSSVEEAVETRNALYNLQWPPNGGRLLIAEFADPQEVKMRLEAPPQPPVAPNPTPIAAPSTPSLQPQQPTGRKGSLKQQLPPPPAVQPTPSTSDSHPPRERLPPPPPPPPTMKSDPPIVTLDDLFRKTKATPRIYYLPLSEEQVAAKLAAQGKNVKA